MTLLGIRVSFTLLICPPAKTIADIDLSFCLSDFSKHATIVICEFVQRRVLAIVCISNVWLLARNILVVLSFIGCLFFIFQVERSPFLDAILRRRGKPDSKE